MITSARIRAEGMGGFLNPPGHPEHHYSVEWGRPRGREGEGSCSLHHAVTEGASYLPEEVVEKAKALLHEWEVEGKHVIDRDWVWRVLGYYRNCYRNPDKSGEKQWDASNLLIVERLPMEHVNDHAGVRFIRLFYPEFQPTEEDFKQAYWGKRPEEVEK